MTIPIPDLDTILKEAILIVKDASGKHFKDRKNLSTTGGSLKASQKNNNPTDIVTEKDVAIEQEIASKLALAFPHILYCIFLIVKVHR